MAPRTEEQFEEIRESRKHLILETALELFASEGFYPTSISKIANKAGISKGLLYNYFESKEALITTIIYNGLDHLSEFFDPNKDGVLTKDELRFFIEEFFNLMINEKRFWKLYFSLFLQPPVMRLVEKRLQVIIRIYLKMLNSYFESQGYADPETESILFGAMMDGIGFNFMANDEMFPVEKIKARLIEMYCKQ